MVSAWLVVWIGGGKKRGMGDLVDGGESCWKCRIVDGLDGIDGRYEIEISLLKWV